MVVAAVLADGAGDDDGAGDGGSGGADDNGGGGVDDSSWKLVWTCIAI